MHCPFCNHEETKVIDSRLAGEGQQVRRRRECLDCNERFTTFESAELVMPRVVKSDDRREPFDEQKMRASMHRALEKRPVSSDDFEKVIFRLVHKLSLNWPCEVGREHAFLPCSGFNSHYPSILLKIINYSCLH